jgi:tartrate dehydratase beta subunit/fumarate hydratase class I family protein
MKYEVVNGLQTKDKYFAKGDIVTNKDIPQKSIKWLLEQKELVKVDNKYQAKKLQEVAMKQEEE